MTTLPQRIGAVLFDMDNTLVLSEYAWSAATDDLWRDASATRGVDILGGTTADIIDAFTAANPDADPAAVERRFMDFLQVHLTEGVVTVPGAPELLERLASAVPLAIASNSPSAIVSDMVTKMGWAGVFTAAVGTEDVARGKPAPDLYLAAARACGVRPEKCVVVEDSPVGATAGRAAGAFVLTVGAVGMGHGDLHVDSLIDPVILAWNPEPEQLT